MKNSLSTCECCGSIQLCEIDFLGVNTCDYCYLKNEKKFLDYCKSIDRNRNNLKGGCYDR